MACRLSTRRGIALATHGCPICEARQPVPDPARPPRRSPPAEGQPWDQRFHLILNLAVGGSFFPSSIFGQFTTVSAWDAAVKTWTRPRMEIEHVKVWAWPPQQP